MEDTTLLRLDGVEICRDENVILHDASFTLCNGEFVYVIGKVGSGKSSLLKSLYCEIPISQGDAWLLDYNLCKMKRKDIPYLRRKLGIVFQDFQLLTDRSVIKNLEFVLRATGWKKIEGGWFCLRSASTMCFTRWVCITKGTRCRTNYRVASSNVSS